MKSSIFVPATGKGTRAVSSLMVKFKSTYEYKAEGLILSCLL